MTQNAQIFLLDKYCDIDLIKNRFSNNLVICFDSETHEKLEENDISHLISDDFLKKNDYDEILDKSFLFSNWYKEQEILDIVTFKNINFGKLFHIELFHILNSFLKLFLEIYYIYKKNPNSKFYCSENFLQIIINFSDNVTKINSTNSNIKNDFVDIQFPLFKKWKIQLSKSKFDKIQNFLEKFVKSSEKQLLTENLFLLTNFTTLKSKDLLLSSKKTKITFLKYDRIVPPFWDPETYNIIKKSGCLLETKNSLMDKKIKNKYEHETEIIFERLKLIEEKEHFFSKYFSINDISFWDAFKTIFLKLCRENFSKCILEILLAEKLFLKFHFSGILLLDESRTYEQIIAHFAKLHNVPIFLLLHGFPSSSEKILRLNQLVQTIPEYCDEFLVWGNLQKQYLLDNHVPESKIIPIGTFLFDKISKISLPIKKPEKQYVLFATDFLALPNPENFSLKYFLKCKNILYSVHKNILENDLDLIIKPHPNKNLGEAKLIKNWKRTFFESGDIVPLIQSSDFVIVTDLSTVILEAFALNKLVISLRIKNDYDSSDIFKLHGCLRIDISDLNNTVKKIQTDPQFREKLLQKQTDFLKKYFSNYGNGSNSILNYLSAKGQNSI